MTRRMRPWAVLAACALFVSACTAPAAPAAPTAAPAAKPTTAPAAKPTEAPKPAAAAAKPTAAPKPAAAAPAAPVATTAPAAAKPAAGGAFDEAAEAKKLYDAAIAAGEKEINLYTSINERESVPYTELFMKTYPGIKVNLLRSDETALTSRIFTEAQANRPNMDVLVTTASHVLVPAGLALSWTPPNAQRLAPEYIDKDQYYFGVYANYNVIQINTNMVKKGAITSYEDLTKPEFKNQMIIDDTDYEWLSGMFEIFGRDKAIDLLTRIVRNGVTVVNGHGNIADKIAAGEYAVAVNNYLNLVERGKRENAPTEWIAVQPVVVDFSKVAINKSAPNPNAAKLFANFTLSTDGQKLLSKTGRIPTRADVPPDPPDLVKGVQIRTAPPLLGQVRETLNTDFKKIFNP